MKISGPTNCRDYKAIDWPFFSIPQKLYSLQRKRKRNMLNRDKAFYILHTCTYPLFFFFFFIVFPVVNF